MQGQIFVISAPSGAGKTTVVHALKDMIAGLGYSISHTSRRPRGTEKDGIDYHFVDRETFGRMIDEGAFVEWATVYRDLYGTSFSSLNDQTALGVDVLVDVDSQGAKNIKNHYKDSVLIYLLPPSLEILEKRLTGRGTDDQSVIDMRMEQARSEIKNCVWYDYIVVNDHLEKAIGEVQAIIISERCRTVNRLPHIKELFRL
jgi:guanylate kinase